MKRHFLFIVLLSLMARPGLAVDAVDPRQAIESNPGDTQGAVRHLGEMLAKHYSVPLFSDFTDRGVIRPNDSAKYAASQILSLQRMGQLSVHSESVKRAFIYLFNTTRPDPARLHEALALYEQYPVANTDDPAWRLIRARCARLMNLPETLELYEQVADDMIGVPPSEDVRKLWEANREAFDLPAYTKEAWAKQTTRFVYDAKGPDVPGAAPIKGSPFAQMDVADVVGSQAADWANALEDAPQRQAKQLDDLFAQAGKYGELPWGNGRGFLNTEQALVAHLINKPAEALAPLRVVQEARYTIATAKGVDPEQTLALFRRYPWSVSAQRQLLLSAQQDLFSGETQAALRSFQDVLRHAQAKSLYEQAQVGLWVTLSQFATYDALAKAFEGIDDGADWPWQGKRVKTKAIKQQLIRESPAAAQPTALASLTLHTLRLPPAPVGVKSQTVFNIDMQRDAQHLLLSSETMLLMYDAGKPGKPLWSKVRRMNRFSAGATQYLPQFDGERVVARWGGDNTGDYQVIGFDRTDGKVVNEWDVHDAQSRFRSRSIGRPVVADEKLYSVQHAQSFQQITRWPPNERAYGDLALSCFDANGNGHRWTRTYESAQTIGMPNRDRTLGVHATISEGAVYFCSNDGHVVRADARDGEMEWMHFFRPSTGNNYYQAPSPWSMGAAPVVAGDKVVCMPKFTGYVFALDKVTGRRVWSVPLLRGYQVLGVFEDLVLVVGANSLYAIETETGKMRWGRSIDPIAIDGFQLPRAQLIGSSIYCGTKNTLYRFDARRGELQESRRWAMGSEAPMSFLVSGADLYVISDLPMKDAVMEKQLVHYHTVHFLAGGHRELVRPIEKKDGGTLIWRDNMLLYVKDKQLVWSRFVSNNKVYRSGFSANRSEVNLSWDNTSAAYDVATGQLLRMVASRPTRQIKIDGR